MNQFRAIPASFCGTRSRGHFLGRRAVMNFVVVVFLVWCCCGLVPVVHSSQSLPPTTSSYTQDFSSLRTLLIGGALPAQYMGQMASFGNPLNGSDGNEMRRTYNLVLPPDDPWLCEYPESLRLLNKSEVEYLVANHMTQYPTPVALLVSFNSCSAETKARVALEIQQTLALQLEVLLVYSPDPSNTQAIQLHPDDFPQHRSTNYLNGLGIIHIPYRYAAGIETRMRMTWNGEDPRFLQGDNHKWSFPIQITNYSGQLDDDERFGSGSTTGSSNNNGNTNGNGSYGAEEAGEIYWFRIILFSILVVSPCCRACYLWYAGGGRFFFRRNERGWIVGLQYVPPAPAWLTTGGRFPDHHGMAPSRRGIATLTEEEFNALPEILYQPPVASHYDEDQQAQPHPDSHGTSKNSGNDTERKPIVLEGTNVSVNNVQEGTKKKTTGEKIQDVPEIVEGKIDLNYEEGKDKLDSMEKGKQKDVNGKLETESIPSDYEPKTSSSSSSNNKTDTVPQTPVPLFTHVPPPTDVNNDNERVEEGGVAALVCKSSVCSICIDDFEANEKIILLPKCQHGFHRDCIHPWVTERQGCCPFCKTPVLGDDDPSTIAAEDEDSDDLVAAIAVDNTAVAFANTANNTQGNENNNNNESPRSSLALLVGEGRRQQRRRQNEPANGGSNQNSVAQRP